MAKKLPTIAALTIATTASALVAAADDWSGFYGGVSGGLGSTKTQFSSLDSNTVDGGEGIGLVTTNTSASASEKDGGVLAGLNIGYNAQIDNFVLGLEADASLFGSKETIDFAGAVGTDQLVADVDNIVTLRARAGVILGNILVFGTGGVALGSVQYDLMTGSGLTTEFKNKSGWVAGGGVEFMITPMMSVQVTITHTDLGSKAVTVSNANSSIDLDSDASMTIGKVGLNLRF